MESANKKQKKRTIHEQVRPEKALRDKRESGQLVYQKKSLRDSNCRQVGGGGGQRKPQVFTREWGKGGLKTAKGEP